MALWYAGLPYIIVFGPLVLTVLATVMALKPPKDRGYGHIIWVAIILLVGIPTSWATLQANLSADRLNNDTNSRVRALSDAISKFVIQQNVLTPHTFHVEAGKIFAVPPVMAEVIVSPRPNIQTTIFLPKVPFQGEEIIVKIGPGNIGNSGFVWVDGSGLKVDGQRRYALAFPGQSCTFKFDGDEWGCT